VSINKQKATSYNLKAKEEKWRGEKTT